MIPDTKSRRTDSRISYTDKILVSYRTPSYIMTYSREQHIFQSAI
jgi:hypothetical protein